MAPPCSSLFTALPNGSKNQLQLVLVLELELLELLETLETLEEVLLLLGELPVVVVVMKMLVISVMVWVAATISTISTILDSFILTVDVTKLVKVDIGTTTVVGVVVALVTLKMVVVG